MTEIAAHPTRRAKGSLPLMLVLLVLLAAPYALRLPLIKTRGFNPDELEHLHWSWCVAKGMVPDRDYFDHHTPWFHFFLAPFFSLYDVEKSADEAIAFMFMARRWMWLFAGGVLALTFLLGRAWREWRTGLVATLLLSNTGFFLSKSLEIRSDVPAAALTVAAVLTALVAVRRANSDSPGASWRLLASGLMLGAATMLTQKTLFIGPGFALVAAWFILDRRLSRSRGQRLRLVGHQVGGYCLPVLLTLGYFAAQGALWPFIDFNFILNARWPGLGAGPFIIELVRQDPFFVLLAAVGFLMDFRRVFAQDRAKRGEPVPALTLLAVWATLPFHPAMSYQHFLLILPLTSLYAGSALVRLVDALADRWRRPLRWAGAPNALLALLVILLSVVPVKRFRAAFDRGNWGTMQAIRYVIRNSAPWETTLDGFTGLGMFRPQAFFHHFLHPHALALQTEEEKRDMLEALRTGRAMPKMIFWSHYLREGVTPEMAAFLQEHYVPTGLEPIRVRPFDNGLGWWSDEQPRYLGWEEGQERAPHVFFDDGWREPGIEYGVPVRHTRTRKSGLIVPIRYPRDFRVTLRARADAEATPFGVELVVNGHSAGVVEATPRWQDYEFNILVGQLRPGFNVFEFRFSSDRASEAERIELAAHSLQLRPVASGG